MQHFVSNKPSLAVIAIGLVCHDLKEVNATKFNFMRLIT